MLKRFLLLLLFMVFLASCSSTAVSMPSSSSFKQSSQSLKEVPLDFIPENYTVVSIGDSLTAGVGDSTKRGGYIPYLKEILEMEKGVKNAEFYNFGVSGSKTGEILQRIKKEEVKENLEKANMVIITTGGNDIMKVVKENLFGLNINDFSKDKEAYEKNLSLLLEEIRSVNSAAPVVLVGVYNPFYQYFADIREIEEVLQMWNDASKSVLDNFEGTFFVPIDQLFKLEGENILHVDYFHPNDRGYKLIANEIFQTIHGRGLNLLYAAGKKEISFNE